MQRILIAEDHQPLAESLVNLLAARGYQPVHAGDGIAALRAIAADPPHLLILDLNLPGLHGVELLKKLRQSPRTKELPVVIVTGTYKGGRYREAAATLGVHHYLEKPFKAGALLQAMAAALATPQESGSEQTPRPCAIYLQQAFRKRFSGQLLLVWPEVQRRLTFFNGAPIALHPGFEHPDLGTYLHRRGVVSATEYAYFAGAGAGRPETLVELGCLSWTELLSAQLAYLDTELECAFGAPPARARWQELAAPEPMPPVICNVPHLFYRGFHRYPGQTAARMLAACLDRYPTPVGVFYNHINFLALDDSERRWLQQLDGQRTLAASTDEPARFAPLILTLSALDMLRFADQPTGPVTPGPRPLRLLFNACGEEPRGEAELPLESFADLVEIEAAAADALAAAAPVPGEAQAMPAGADLSQNLRQLVQGLAGKNHYEIFDIPPGQFTIDLLKERYFAITRRYGPDILMQLAGEDAAMVEELLTKVANAYNTLSDVVRKERYDELLGADKIGLGHKGDDRFQAQVQAESGKIFIEMDEWANAEKALQEAVNFDTGNGDYLAHLAWAIYRNPHNAVSRAMQDKARQLLNRALTLERTAPGFAFKGWMLLESGQDALAEAEFNKALKLDARSQLARRGLRTLQEKQEQQKKGLFGRMFR